jgi:hypothetical protein
MILLSRPSCPRRRSYASRSERINLSSLLNVSLLAYKMIKNDQNASSLTPNTVEQVHGVTIELTQILIFYDRCRTKLHRGVEVIGTEKAIKEEMMSVWGRMRGEEGKVVRGRFKTLRERYRQSTGKSPGRNGGAGKVLLRGVWRCYL